MSNQIGLCRKVVPFLLSLIISSLAFADTSLHVKYRDTPVNVSGANFEFVDTAKSSLVTGAWFDASKGYMIIGLSGVNYHYCGLDHATWNQFKKADSFGKFYLQRIKGRFDCRINPVPDYKD